MNRGRILIASSSFIVIFTAFVLWDVLRKPEPAEEPREEAMVEPPSTPEEAAPAPAERRHLAISGIVFGDGLLPREGMVVSCEGESVITAANGAFSFPASLRRRVVGVRVAKADREVAVWENIVAGDPEPPEPSISTVDEVPPPQTFHLEDTVVPALPERIRWTIVTPSESGGGQKSGDWIRLGEAFAEEWGNGARARVRGTTDLLDGAHVSVSLYFDGSRFLGSLEPAPVKGGTFTAVLGCPPDIQFFSAPYEARASFNLLLETSESVEEWKRARPDVEWESLVAPEVTKMFFLGDPEEDRRDNLAAQSYYGGMLDKATMLDRTLKGTLKSKTDETRVFAQGRGLSSRSRNQGPKAWLSDAFLLPDGSFDAPKWRQFLDEDWRPKVRALQEEHAARAQEKYKEAASRLGSLLKALLDESYCYSRFCVYQELHLPLDEKDFYPDEDQAGDMVRLENLVRENTLSLERYRKLVD